MAHEDGDREVGGADGEGRKVNEAIQSPSSHHLVIIPPLKAWVRKKKGRGGEKGRWRKKTEREK